jgi:hypothetical protein
MKEKRKTNRERLIEGLRLFFCFLSLPLGTQCQLVEGRPPVIQLPKKIE